MIEWVIRGAQSSKLLDQIVVATDDSEIASVATRCGVQAVMTPSDLPTGSDRIWFAGKELSADIILNIQGDEPLISGKILDPLIQRMLERPEIEVGTLGHAFSNSEDFLSQNTAKIVLNDRSEAIYFSRHPIPYSRNKAEIGRMCNLQHIGIYAYRKAFLRKFCESTPCDLELAEGLEQLRALYLGARINVVKVDFQTLGVDTLEDAKKVEELLRKREKL